MSLTNDRVVKKVMDAAMKRKKENGRVYAHTPLPNKTQTLLSLQATADVLGIPFIEFTDKLLNQGEGHAS